MDNGFSPEIHDEVRYSFCDGCKGQQYMNESGCYEICEAYKKECAKIKKEWNNE